MESFPISIGKRRSGRAAGVAINIILVVLIVIILAEIVFFSRFRRFYVVGESMYPTLIGAERTVSGRIRSGTPLLRLGSPGWDLQGPQAPFFPPEPPGSSGRRGRTARPVLAVDGIRAGQDDYVDFGRPLMDGMVIPAVVKTLLFG